MGGDICFIIRNFGMGNDNIIRWNSLIELAEQVKIHFCPSHQKRRLYTQLADSLKDCPIGSASNEIWNFASWKSLFSFLPESPYSLSNFTE